MEKELRIAVKQIPSGKFSTHANQALSVGHILDVMAPTGKFFTKLSSAHEKQYLAFVAGSGITPVISIIKATLSLEPKSSFTLVYGNRDRHSIIFKEQLENLKDRYLDRLMVLIPVSVVPLRASEPRTVVAASPCMHQYQQ